MSNYEYDDLWLRDMEHRREKELEDEEHRHWQRIERLYEKGELPLKTNQQERNDG